MTESHQQFPPSLWESVHHGLRQQFPFSSRVLIAGVMGLPILNAVELIRRPELHRYLHSQVTGLESLVASRYTAHERRRLGTLPMHYSTYIEIHDYAHVLGEEWSDTDEFDEAQEQGEEIFAAVQGATAEQSSLAILHHHEEILRGFATRLALQEATLSRRIERLLPRIEPVRVQSVSGETSFHSYEAILHVNDIPVQLGFSCEDTFQRIALDRHLPAELIPVTKFASDLFLKAKAAQPGTPFVDLRFVVDRWHKGRPTWIDVESWTRTTTNERERYGARGETRIRNCQPPVLT